MTALIIEDEDLAVRKLRKLLADVDPNLKINGVTPSIEDSVNWLRENAAPDVIFMDIELADGQCFEIFNQVEIKSRVIFTTSYDEYVLPAFRMNNIDYLLKPILKEDLQQSLRKLQVEKDENSFTESLTAINVEKFLEELQAVSNPADNGFSKRFLAKQGQKLLPVEVDDIMYFYINQNFSVIETRFGQKFNLDYTIDELIPQLDPQQFFRINDKMIITRKAVSKVQAYDDDRLLLVLKPAYGKEVVLKPEKVAEFKSWMGK